MNIWQMYCYPYHICCSQHDREDAKACLHHLCHISCVFWILQPICEPQHWLPESAGAVLCSAVEVAIFSHRLGALQHGKKYFRQHVSQKNEACRLVKMGSLIYFLPVSSTRKIFLGHPEYSQPGQKRLFFTITLALYLIRPVSP